MRSHDLGLVSLPRGWQGPRTDAKDIPITAKIKVAHVTIAPHLSPYLCESMVIECQGMDSSAAPTAQFHTSGGSVHLGYACASVSLGPGAGSTYKVSRQSDM